MKKIVLCVVLLAVTSTIAQVRQESAVRYVGPRGVSDFGTGIVFDPTSQNVYVTGSSAAIDHESDYATIAYDLNGNELWVASYNGPGNFSNYPSAIALDSSRGHIYVTGSSTGANGRNDFATIAYDQFGNELWVARYDGAAQGSLADGMALDPITGNIYVTGSSLVAGGHPVYATVAYDPDGNQLWTATYDDGPPDHANIPTAVAVDSGTGNVYVTGYTRLGTDFHTDDYVTVAYDSAGNELWVARYDGPAHDADLAWAIAVDSGSGNVYVTGQSIGIGTGNDYATVAYDSSGHELWVARYDGPFHDVDVPRAIVVDAGTHNLYITGLSTRAQSVTDYATVAYDSDGNELWVARYQGEGTGADARTVAVDTESNVYVTGSSHGKYGTVAYDSGGNEKWVALYRGTEDGGWGSGLAVDNTTKDIYVTGAIWGNGFHWDTVKYSQPVP